MNLKPSAVAADTFSTRPHGLEELRRFQEYLNDILQYSQFNMETWSPSLLEHHQMHETSWLVGSQSVSGTHPCKSLSDVRFLPPPIIQGHCALHHSTQG